jgi:integrase
MSGHIRQRSPGSFEIRYRANGVLRTETVRGSKKIAAARLRELMASVDRGQHPAPSKTTVGDWLTARVELWLTSGRIGARTAESYRWLAAQAISFLGDHLVQKLDTASVEAWHASMLPRLSPRTAREAHRLLASGLDDAVRHRLVSSNVARVQGPPRVKRPAPIPTLKADQIDGLLTKLDDAWRAPVITALYCGLRRGEQLALKWAAVDLDRRVLQVREALDETKAHGVVVKLPKSAAGVRDISLPTVVVDALRGHRGRQLEQRLLLGLGRPARDSLVFPGRDGGYDSPRAFTLRWRRAAVRFGIRGTSWHLLRHAHASMLIAQRVPVTTVAARLGHADPSVTLKIYSHLYARDDSAAAAAIDAALGQL